MLHMLEGGDLWKPIDKSGIESESYQFRMNAT